MADFFKSQEGDITQVQIIGPIDENTNFESSLGDIPGEIVVNCRGIPRINSVGVKAWINYFKSLIGKGASIKLVECSPAIVEQINMISNFTAGASVESILVPYICPSDDTEITPCFTIPELLKTFPKIPEVKCDNGDDAEFDDIPEEYFGFLERDHK